MKTIMNAAENASRATILAAYRVAREMAAAANPELDEALDSKW